MVKAMWFLLSVSVWKSRELQQSEAPRPQMQKPALSLVHVRKAATQTVFQDARAGLLREVQPEELVLRARLSEEDQAEPQAQRQEVQQRGNRTALLLGLTK